MNKKNINTAPITLDKFTLSKKHPQTGEEVKKMEGNKPEHVRVGGIEVAIWDNDKMGKTVTIQRSYKDKNNEWQKTASFRTNDIPKAILALQKAYENIVLKNGNSGQ